MNTVFKIETREALFLFVVARNGKKLLCGFKILLPDNQEEILLKDPLRMLEHLVGKRFSLQDLLEEALLPLQNLNKNEREVLAEIFSNNYARIMGNFNGQKPTQAQRQAKHPILKVVHSNPDHAVKKKKKRWFNKNRFHGSGQKKAAS